MRTAHRRPRDTTKAVPMKTRTRLRADQAMRRADHLPASGWPRPLQRRLQIALGVDQEIGGSDDLLALAQRPRGSRRIRRRDARSSPSRGSKRPSPLSRITTSRVPVSMMALSGTVMTVSPSCRRDFGVDIHVRAAGRGPDWRVRCAPRTVRVSLVDLRIDQADATAETLAGQAARPNGRPLPRLDPRVIAVPTRRPAPRRTTDRRS